MNMWSALIFAIFNVAAVLWMIETHPEMPLLIRLSFLLHGFGRGLSWAGSWVFHTFNAVSLSLSNALIKLDYVGCLLSIFCISTNNLVTELYCEPVALALIVAACGSATLACVPFFLSERYHSERYRWPRMLLFCASITAGSLPLVLLKGGRRHYYYLSAAYLVETFAGVLYSIKQPEKSGHESLLINSHILWHLFNLPFDVLILMFQHSAYESLASRPGSCLAVAVPGARPDITGAPAAGATGVPLAHRGASAPGSWGHAYIRSVGSVSGLAGAGHL